MNWRDRFSAIYAARNHEHGPRSKPRFQQPASMQEITATESDLGVQLPTALKELLLQANGVMALLEIDGEWIENMWVVWPADMITTENLRFRQQWAKDSWGRSFDELLFFTSAGSDGILFAHPREGGNAIGANVLVWVPIGDELTPVAPSLESFLEGWLTGALQIR